MADINLGIVVLEDCHGTSELFTFCDSSTKCTRQAGRHFVYDDDDDDSYYLY